MRVEKLDLIVVTKGSFDKDKRTAAKRARVTTQGGWCLDMGCVTMHLEEFFLQIYPHTCYLFQGSWQLVWECQKAGNNVEIHRQGVDETNNGTFALGNSMLWKIELSSFFLFLKIMDYFNILLDNFKSYKFIQKEHILLS